MSPNMPYAIELFCKIQIFGDSIWQQSKGLLYEQGGCTCSCAHYQNLGTTYSSRFRVWTVWILRAADLNLQLKLLWLSFLTSRYFRFLSSASRAFLSSRSRASLASCSCLSYFSRSSRAYRWFYIIIKSGIDCNVVDDNHRLNNNKLFSLWWQLFMIKQNIRHQCNVFLGQCWRYIACCRANPSHSMLSCKIEPASKET